MSLSQLRAGPEHLNQALLITGENEANTESKRQVEDAL